MRTLNEHNQAVIARGDQREPDDVMDDGGPVAELFAIIDEYTPVGADADADYVQPEFDLRQFDGLDPVALVRALELWQQRKERLDAVGKQIGRVFDFLRITKIPTTFDELGITLLKVDGVGRCSLTADLHASIATGSKDQAFAWLRDTGRGDVIAETVSSSTLKAILKKALLAAEPLPEGVFNVSPFTRASITHGK